MGAVKDMSMASPKVVLDMCQTKHHLFLCALSHITKVDVVLMNIPGKFKPQTQQISWICLSLILIKMTHALVTGAKRPEHS